MSAVAALPLDPVFSMDSKQTYSAWPVFEIGHGLLGHDLAAAAAAASSSSYASYASDASLSPPPTTSRSATASPPHYGFALTAPQRELKRQREQIRREAKAALRRGRDSPGHPPPLPARRSTLGTESSSSTAGSPPPTSLLPSPPLHGSAVTMADLGGASSSAAGNGGLPSIYATSAAAPPPPPPPSQMPLLGEPAYLARTTAGGGAAAGPYSPSAHPGVFSASYPGHAAYLAPEYTTAAPYSSAPSPVPAPYPRTAMHDQQNLLYHMPPPPPTAAMIGAGPMHLAQHAPPLASHGPLVQQQHHHQQQQHHHQHHHHGLADAGRPHPHMPATAATTPPLHDGSSHQAYEMAMGGSGAAGVGSGSGSSSSLGVGVGGGAGPGGMPPGVRVVQSRPKPQCWEHGCNGRQFSTFSNLLRHQREKSGQAAKAVCPNCGAEFTRTTARNGHLQHDKCKQRRQA